MFEHADPETYSQIAERFTRWTDIDIHHRGAKTTSGGHGFSAIGRRESAAHPPGAGASPGCGHPLRDRGAARVRAGLGRSGRRRRRRVERGAHGARARLRPHARPAPLPLHLARHRPRVRRLQVLHRRTRGGRGPGSRLPLRRRHEHVHRRDARADLEAAWPGRAPDRRRGRLVLGDVRRRARRPSPATRTTPAGSTSSPFATGAGASTTSALLGDAAHTAHFSIGSGTKLAMEDAVALAWAFRSFGDDVVRRHPRLRVRAPADRREHPAGRAGLARVVRGNRPLPWTGAAPVRVQPADPQPPGDLRQPEAARPGVRAVGASGSAAADVHAVALARAGDCRTASSSRPWTCTRRSTVRPATSISCTWAPARSAAPACS